MPSVLIVDDQKELHDILKVVVQPLGCTAHFAFNGQEALELFKKESFDVVLTDISMTPMDGISLLQEVRTLDPQAIVLLMTGYGSMETAVRALKHGAYDYIQKPLKIKEFVAALKKALEARSKGNLTPTRPNNHNQKSVTTSVQENEVCIPLIGNSKGVAKARSQVERLLQVSTPVLLEGPAGSGKKMVALHIHRSGKYGEGRFVGVDCSVVTNEDMRLQIMGQDGLGGDLLEKASGGTLYLQSVEALDIKLQASFAKLLKAVGHEFRLVCSSTVDLEEKMDLGEFSHELFYRIALAVVHLPNMSARKGDIPDVVRAVIDQSANFKFDSRKIEVSDATLKELSTRDWKCNIEELVQKVMNAVTNTEERVIPPELINL